MTYHEPIDPCAVCGGAGWIAVEVDFEEPCPVCEAWNEAVLLSLADEPRHSIEAIADDLERWERAALAPTGTDGPVW
jgi:hypothetical protein